MPGERPSTVSRAVSYHYETTDKVNHDMNIYIYIIWGCKNELQIFNVNCLIPSGQSWFSFL